MGQKPTDLDLPCFQNRIPVYGKCSKILNTFHFLFSKKMWVIMAAIHKMVVRVANREDPDQSDLGLHCLSRPF